MKLIITCFAGRKEYLEIQLKYIIELLNRYEFIERYDIWNFAWNESDVEYVNSLEELHPKIKVCHSPDYGMASRGNDIASKQFSHFYSKAYPHNEYKNHMFLKIDDDVLYIDINRFGNFIKERLKYPDHFLVSADVVNNQLMDINPSNIHNNFFKLFPVKRKIEVEDYDTNKRLSINFVTWMGKHLPHIIEEFSNGVGRDDEIRMCKVIPNKHRLKNVIIKNYNVVHFSFGTQSFDKEEYLKKYKHLCDMIIS